MNIHTAFAAGNAIGRNRVLTGLSPDDTALLAPHLTETVLERGRWLQQPGDPIERVYFLHSGLVSWTSCGPDGPPVESLSVGRDGVIGLLAGLGGTTASAGAVVQMTARAAQIPAAQFAAAVARSETLQAEVVRQMETLATKLHRAVLCAATHSLQGRLCRWLLETRERAGATADLAITQENLANLLGVQRTSVTFIIAALQAEGAVQTRRGRLLIREPRALEARACSCCQRAAVPAANGVDGHASWTPPAFTAAAVAPSRPRSAP